MMRLSISVAVVLAAATLFSAAPGFPLRADDDRPRVVCHKGEGAEAPENTLPAFQLAIDRGLPAFECDIRVSKDGGLFCYHDNDMSRFGGPKDRSIENSTSAELEAYDAGAYVGDRWKGTKMPQLKDILALARDGLLIQVELKMHAAGVPLVKAEFTRHPEATPGRVMFVTGFLDTIAALKREMPDYKVYWAHGTHWGKEQHVVWPTTWELFQKLKKAGVKPDGVTLAGQPIMDRKYWGDFKRAGYEVGIWTIDDPKEVKRYLDDGVDWVTTNYGKRTSDFIRAERAKEKGLLGKSDLPRHGVGETLLTRGWRFVRDYAEGSWKEPIEPSYDDSWWQTVRVPHDWAIGGPFDPKGEGATGKLPWKGVGVYRYAFELDESARGKNVFFDFDGVMAAPKVYFNGHQVAGWNYGYLGFRSDVTKWALPGRRNVLTVYANTREHLSRWYPGAGIYRKVALKVVGDDFVVPGSVRITTPKVAEAEATVDVTWENAAKGRRHRSFTVKKPRLWDVDDPHLYEVELDGERHRYGIRTFAFTAHDGFLLNGRRLQIQGANLHADLGLLGMAFDVSAARRQLMLMKDMGVNAIRTSHNPPAPEFLDLCDELGFLVWDECFDRWDLTSGRTWQKLEPYVIENLQAFVRRDRNHPSVVVWSLGNEMGIADEKDAEDPRMTKARCSLFRRKILELDETRPVGIGCVGTMSEPQNLSRGVFDDLDVLGWNYRASYRPCKRHYPDKPVLYSESASAVSSRGVYCPSLPNKLDGWGPGFQVDSYDHCAKPDIPDVEFSRVSKDKYLCGEFVWTGIDYLGEPTPFWHESRSSYFGTVDLTGLPKDRFWLYRSQWNRKEETVHLLPHWSWPGHEGKVVPVFVYTSGDEAELFLNGKSLGRRKRGRPAPDRPKDMNPYYDVCKDYRLAWWSVAYVPGELRAVAYRSGRRIGEDIRRTAGKPAGLKLEAEPLRTRDDGELVWVHVKAVDVNGVEQPRADDRIAFAVEGPGTILGVGNGDAHDLDSFAGISCRLFGGVATAVVRREGPGVVSLRVSAPGLGAASVELPVPGMKITESGAWMPMTWTGEIEKDSALDFSSLRGTDAPAGCHGRVIVRGDHFAFEDSPDIARRFYGVNLCGTSNLPDRDEADRLAQTLARVGYNAVRLHHHDDGLVTDEGGRTVLDNVAMRKFDGLVAACVSNGLYLTTDLFVSRRVPYRAIEIDRDGFADMNELKELIILHPPAYSNFLAFAENFLGHVNVYTGRRLADEPALMGLSLVNEGGLGGWQTHWAWRNPCIQEAFRQWLLRKKQSESAYRSRYDLPPPNFQDARDPQVLVYQEFLRDAEVEFVRNTTRFLRKRLRCRVPLTNMNSGYYTVANQVVRAKAYDYVDNHFYLDHPAFDPGTWGLPSRCDNQNVFMLTKGKMCGPENAFLRVYGKPFTVSEFNYAAPSCRRGVGGLYVGAAAAAQGWSGVWRFAWAHDLNTVRHPDTCGLDYLNAATDPLALAGERAAACLFLRGDLRPQTRALALHLPPSKIAMDRADPKLHDCTLDWNQLVWRARVGTYVGESLPKGYVTAGAYPSVLTASADDWTNALARRSNAPGIIVDRTNGTFAVTTPCTCAAFSENVPVRAGALEMSPEATPTTAWVSALDGRPLSESRRMLLSVLTDVQMTDVVYSDASCRELRSWGRLPRRMRVARTGIGLKMGDGAFDVYALTSSGRRRVKVASVVTGGCLKLMADTSAVADDATYLYEIVRRARK